MRVSTWSFVLVAVGLQASSSVVSAQLPENRLVYFQMHEDPSDSSSAVTFVVTAHLEAADRADDSVGWSITSLEFERPDSDQSWTAALPEVDTPDGLWWVDHADADAPDPSEFTVPPPLTGEAIADSSEYDNLSYNLAGYTVGEGPYAITSIMSYRLHLALDPDPGDEGDHEPVESGGGPEPD